jgi:hypothetical protein
MMVEGARIVPGLIWVEYVLVLMWVEYPIDVDTCTSLSSLIKKIEHKE